MNENISAEKLIHGKFAEAGIPLAAFSNTDIKVHTNADGTKRVEVKDRRLRLPRKPAALKSGATAKERKAYKAAFAAWLAEANRRVAEYGARRKSLTLLLMEMACRKRFAQFVSASGVDLDFDSLQFKAPAPWIDPRKDEPNGGKPMTWDEVADQEAVLLHYGVKPA